MKYWLLGLLLLAPLSGHSAAATADEQGRWTINMRDVDIRDFTEQVASISGQTLVLDPRVKGKVSVVSQTPLRLSEVYQLFLSVLSTHGYAVVNQDGQARIIPDSEARTQASAAQQDADSLETRLLQVQHASVSELLPLIRPLVPQQGHLAAIPSSNALIVSDRRANIERLLALINQVDRASSDDSSFYDLRHAWAKDVAGVLLESLQRQPGRETGSLQVIADTRSNRLLLLGPPEARQRLLKLAQQLDVAPLQAANTRVIRLRHGDAKQLAETLGELADPLRQEAADGSRRAPLMIRADQGLNALILMAEPDIVAQLESIVRQLDVPRAQVLVEAAIVEMSGDVSQALGVQWAVADRSGNSALGGSNFSNSGLSVGTLLGALEREQPINLPDGAIVGIGSNNFGALITALSANGNSNLLSTPSLLTLDNQPAEILVGQNVPFQTGSYTTDAAGANNPFTTIERKDVGVTLKVTPHINEGGTLRLVIEQEISSLAPSAGVAAQAVDLVTNKRLIKSTVLADHGQVIVLGGLIQDDVTRSVSKVPLLGDLPLLGGLFRSSRDLQVKRNLMVFLRPSVVRDGAGLAALSRDKYRDIQLYTQQQDSQRPLPAQLGQLFERDTDSSPAVDLRRSDDAPANPPQPFAAPPSTPLQPAQVQDPGHGQGGDEAPAQTQRRHSILLVEGRGEAFMRAMLSRHPKEPLRLQRLQRDGQDWFQLFYGDYPSAELARLAQQNLPASLPAQRSRLWPL